MTDHLEPYRRMARSIRFFPPRSLTGPSQESMAKAVTPAPMTPTSSWNTIAENYEISALEPPIDPSEHVAALVHEAVHKPTVLPATYAIQENIGDRISRLAPPSKPVKSFINQFKIPQPDPNWIPASTIEPQALQAETRELLDEGDPEVSTSAAVVAPSPIVEEIPVEASVAVAEPEEVQPTPAEASVAVAEPEEVQPTPAEASVVAEPEEVQPTPAEASVVAEPEEVQSTPAEASVVAEPEEVQPTPAEASVVAEPEEVQSTNDDTAQDNTPVDVVSELADTIKPQSLKSDTKKLSDDASIEASVSGMDVAPPPTVEEPPSDEPAADVESVAVEETLDEEVAAADVVEPVEVQETPAEASAAVVAEPIAVEQTPEETSSEVMTEPVASPVEAVTIPLKEPEADKKLTETVVDSAPARDETAAKSETVEIACPKCESTNLRKNGLRQGKQRYVCKDCGKQFAVSDSGEEVKPQKVKSSSRVETANLKESESEPELSTSSQRSGKKKKAKAKGFGNPKGK